MRTENSVRLNNFTQFSNLIELFYLLQPYENCRENFMKILCKRTKL